MDQQHIEAAALSAAQKTLNGARGEMENMCYLVARKVQGECEKNFKTLLETTFNVNIDNKESVEKLQAGVRYARNKVENAEQDKRTVRATVIGGVITWIGGLILAILATRGDGGH